MPIQFPPFDIVKYLVGRKFPALTYYQHPPALTGHSGGPSFDDRQKYLEKYESYLNELNALSDDELKKRYDEEEQQELKQLRAKRQAEEQGRFFNASSSGADFAHWAKATYWTLDEAIALSFGKSPAVVTWKRIEEYVNVSPFASEFAKVRDLSIRAKNFKQLSDPIYPSVFLAWAKRNDFSCPEELENLVAKYGQNLGNWKTAYDNLKASYDTLETSYDTLEVHFAKKNQELKEILESTAALVEERDSLLKQVAELGRTEKPLNPKERESLLKLVIGMAIKGYSYDPNMSRSPTTKEIGDDLSNVGLLINEDTVRKWLKEAAGLLPGEAKFD